MIAAQVDAFRTGESDDKLAQAFQAGEPGAFTKVYTLYESAVRDRIEHYTPPNLQSEVDDICQHLWTHVFQYSSSYDPTRPLRNWLFLATRRAASSYYNDTTKKRSHSLTGQNYTPFGDEAGDESGDEAGDENTYCPVDPKVGPAEKLIFQEALDQIPENFGQAIRAIYFDGKSTVEYARENGITRQTVYTRVSRGLEQLRQLLA